jgi:hypothetical protein
MLTEKKSAVKKELLRTGRHELSESEIPKKTNYNLL